MINIMLYKLLTERTRNTVFPEHYLKAGSETLGFLLLGSWILTLVFNPEALRSNLIKDRIGYNNICVGFDTSPARYFALPCFVLKAYLDIRYVFTATQRSDLEREDGMVAVYQHRFSLIANGTYGFYLLFLPFLVFVEPVDSSSVNFHYGVFALLILLRYLFISANFAQSVSTHKISTWSWVWFSLFTFATFASLTFSAVDFALYDAQKGGEQAPPIPWVLLMITDYMWFMLVFLTTKFLPDLSPIHVKYSLLPLASDNTKILPLR